TTSPTWHRFIPTGRQSSSGMFARCRQERSCAQTDMPGLVGGAGRPVAWVPAGPGAWRARRSRGVYRSVSAVVGLVARDGWSTSTTWLTDSQFLDAVAVGQIAPGPVV